jgi:hypothetical protein
MPGRSAAGPSPELLGWLVQRGRIQRQRISADPAIPPRSTAPSLRGAVPGSSWESASTCGSQRRCCPAAGSGWRGTGRSWNAGNGMGGTWKNLQSGYESRTGQLPLSRRKSHVSRGERRFGPSSTWDLSPGSTGSGSVLATGMGSIPLPKLLPDAGSVQPILSALQLLLPGRHPLLPARRLLLQARQG